MSLQRSVFVMVILVALVLPVFATGGGEQGADEEITLTVWDYKYGEVNNAQPVFRQLDEMFMADNPNISIEHVGQPNNQYYDIIRAAVAAQSGPDVVMYHGGGSQQEFVDYQLVLDDYIADWKDQINPASLAATAPGGDISEGIRGVPISTQLLGFYYNKVLFEQAGLDPDSPPVDWDDFVAACEALLEAGITPMIWANSPAITTLWQMRLFTKNYADRELQRQIGDAEVRVTDLGWFRDVLVYMKEFIDRGWVNEEGVSHQIFNEGVPNFVGGRGAMITSLGSDIANWKDFEDALGRGNVGFFPNVHFPGTVYRNQMYQNPAGMTWTVATWSEHPEEGVEFIKHYATGEGAEILMVDLAALVPNIEFDYGALGYSSLEDIVSYFPNGGRAYDTWISAGASAEIQSISELYFNYDEITVDEFVAEIQRVLDEDNE